MLEDGGLRIHSFYETRGLLLGGECVVPYESAQVGHARFEVVREVSLWCFVFGCWWIRGLKIKGGSFFELVCTDVLY